MHGTKRNRNLFFNIRGVRTKNNMLCIQPVTVSTGDEELTPVCPRTTVCLCEDTKQSQKTILKTMFVLTTYR